jgi:hypothetical protein
MRLDGFAPIASSYGVDLATDRASCLPAHCFHPQERRAVTDGVGMRVAARLPSRWDTMTIERDAFEAIERRTVLRPGTTPIRRTTCSLGRRRRSRSTSAY